MNLKSTTYKFKVGLNERGIGIIGVMVAAALVVVAAFTVANFVTDQWRQSMKLEISGSCQNIANSLVEYIKKDETSLFITSYGAENGNSLPTSGAPYLEYPATLDFTDDGIDRFRFNPGTPIRVHNSGPAPLLTLASSRPVLNAGWSYYNHLNLRNSTNRLVALAAAGNYCCDDLDMNGGGCGAEFYSDAMPRPGFRITDRNVDVFLAVNVPNAAGGSLCTGQTLLTSNIPNSRHNAPIDFKVRVTINRDQDNQRICEATGRVQRNVDVEPSLTLLQYDTDFCASPGPTPALCGTGTNVVLRVKTVKDTNGTNSCQNNCLAGIHSELCDDIGPGELSLFNGFTHGSCAAANCTDSEPGSSFLCKIGEKSWFDSATTLAAWQPCETATVRDSDGTDIPGAAVRIRYEPVINTVGQSERTTRAVITLSGLLSNRGYVADVRAIDTAGNVGPSFCESSASCNEPNAHFVLVAAPPAPGAITDASVHVANMATAGQAGRLTNSTATPALANFGAGNFYQCQTGTPVFQTTTGSTGPAPIDTCTATYFDATGASSNPYCPCANGICTVVMPAPVSQAGDHRIEMLISNACGDAPAPATLNWCNDNIASIGITANPIPTAVAPNLSNYITYPTTGPGGAKACGLLTMCPQYTGAHTPIIRDDGATPTCNAPSGIPSTWSNNSHSGCIADPTNNLCAIVYDPCGRSQTTSTTAPSPEGQFATYLANGAATTNECYSSGGAPVTGNFCSPSDTSFCSSAGKCVLPSAATYPRLGQACTYDAQCDHPSLGANHVEADGPRCVGGFCAAPTNKDTPVVAGSCGSHYCEELNSCGINIGNTPDGGATCTPCNHWVRNESACAETAPGSNDWRHSVTWTCPGGNCCFARPPDLTNQPCPSCGPARGGTFTTAPPTGQMCSIGAVGSPDPATDTGSGWAWNCTQDGRSVACTANKPPPGFWCQTNTNTNSTCTPPGTVCPAVGSSCLPIGSTQSCDCTAAGAYTRSREFTCQVGACAPATAGTCGTANGTSVATAPTTGLCTVGVASPVTTGGPGWVWDCVGTGSTASCSANTSATCVPTSGPGSPTITWRITCGATISNQNVAPNIAAVKAATPPGGTLAGISGGPGWQCATTNTNMTGTQNVSATSNNPSNTYSYVEMVYSSTTYTAWAWARSSSSEFCTRYVDWCTGGSGGSLPEGIDLGSVAAGFTGYSYIGTRACVPPVVNGACGAANGTTVGTAPTTGLCNAGTASAVAGTGPWTWTCAGSGGGSTANCSANIVAVVNGACGTSNGGSFPSAPTTNLCTAGSPSAVTGTGPWNWTCAGSGGGSTANCSATSSTSQCVGIARHGEDIWSSVNWACSNIDTQIGTRVGQPIIVRGDGRMFLLTTPAPTNPVAWEEVTASITACGWPGEDMFDPSYFIPWLSGPIGNPPVSICTP